MTKDEAMQLAMDALETVTSKPEKMSYYCSFAIEIEALRTALAQPKKKWVGLTAYEVQELHIKNPHFGNFACAIEAKLKEKNS